MAIRFPKILHTAISKAPLPEPDKKQASGSSTFSLDGTKGLSASSWRGKINKFASGNVASRAQALLSPLTNNPDEKQIEFFFQEGLPQLLALNKINPKAVRTALRNNLTKMPKAFVRLVQIAVGENVALETLAELESVPAEFYPSLLSSIRHLAVYKPHEAKHLLVKLAQVANAPTQLEVLKTLTFTELGNRNDLTRVFAGLTEHDPKVLRKTVFPKLIDLVRIPFVDKQSFAAKQGWLAELTKGFLSEAQDNRQLPKTLANALNSRFYPGRRV